MSAEGQGYERPGVAGSGTIALGVAACASALGPVALLARSEGSAERAEAALREECERIEGADPGAISVAADPATLSDCDLVVEAIVEDADAKVALLGRIAAVVPDADLATTTSSLGVAELAEAASVAGRLFGLHVFNPVAKMELVELCLPAGLDPAAGERARGWCESLGKRAVEVPDMPGFVVNRLLFPYLFDAVRLLESSGIDPDRLDECMKLGAGHPMGPLALLDFVGIDVAIAIGEELHAASGEGRDRPPNRLTELAAAGRLGRKAGAGFYDYGG